MFGRSLLVVVDTGTCNEGVPIYALSDFSEAKSYFSKYNVTPVFWPIEGGRILRNISINDWNQAGEFLLRSI